MNLRPPVFLWCTGSCFLYWTLAWKLKRAGWIVLSLKIKKTVACLKSPQRQLIVKKWWSQLKLNQRHKKFQSFALPTELWDHGTDRRSWTHINGFGDRCSTIELYPYINLEQITGIEPALPAWEAGVLTIERYLHLVLPKRLEPGFASVKGSCPEPFGPRGHIGRRDGSRTRTDIYPTASEAALYTSFSTRRKL